MGLRETSHLHRKNAVFLHGRSQNPGGAHRMDFAHHGCVPVEWGGIYRGCVRQHYADAGPAEGIARRFDRRGRLGRNHRSLIGR